MPPFLPRPRWRLASLGLALCASTPSLAEAAPVRAVPGHPGPVRRQRATLSDWATHLNVDSKTVQR